MTGLPKNLFNKIRQMIFQYTSSQRSNITTLQSDVADIQSITPIKVYKSYLSQIGLNEPVATELINTLSGTPIYSRAGAGDYLLTLTGEFPDANKVIIRILDQFGGGYNFTYWNDANSIGIITKTGFGLTPGLDSILNAWLEIEIYP